MKKRKLLPGDLVRPNRSVNVNIWDSYEVNKCPNGAFRARMKKSRFTLYCEHVNRLAFVIDVPSYVCTIDDQSPVIGLFIPSLNAFGYTWERELVLVNRPT